MIRSLRLLTIDEALAVMPAVVWYTLRAQALGQPAGATGAVVVYPRALQSVEESVQA